MALTDIATPVEFTFDGTVVSFNYPHRVETPSDLLITLIGIDGSRSELQPNLDFYVRDITGKDATIEFDTAHSNGDRAVVERQTDRTQPVNVRDAKRGLALPVQDALDRIVALAQDLGVLGDRAIKTPPEEFDRPLMMPSRGERAGKMVGFSSDGDAFHFPLNVEDMVPVAENAKTFLDLGDALPVIVALAAQISGIEQLSTRADLIDRLGDIDHHDALMCVADELQSLLDLAADAGPLEALINQSLVREGLAGLAKTAGLYEDEGPVDGHGLDEEDEGCFPAPSPRPIADRGEILGFIPSLPVDPAQIGDRYVVADSQFAEWAVPAGGETPEWILTDVCDTERVTVAGTPDIQYIYVVDAWCAFRNEPLFVYGTATIRPFEEGFIV